MTPRGISEGATVFRSRRAPKDRCSVQVAVLAWGSMAQGFLLKQNILYMAIPSQHATRSGRRAISQTIKEMHAMQQTTVYNCLITII